MMASVRLLYLLHAQTIVSGGLAWLAGGLTETQAPTSELPIQTLMAPLYRKIKTVRLRQAWLCDPDAILARYGEAMAGVVNPPLQPDPSLDQMIQAILDAEEADQSTSVVMRAIAA
jgi:hypothetical protein